MAKIGDLNSYLPDLPDEAIRAIKAPTLLMIGDSDIVQPECAVETFRLLGGGVIGDLAGLPASQVAILPGNAQLDHHAARRPSGADDPLLPGCADGLIPSEQRATVLSFAAPMGSAGGVVAQPVLGRVADVNGYAASYLVAAGIQALAIPFAFLARRENAPSDPILNDAEVATEPGSAA